MYAIANFCKISSNATITTAMSKGGNVSARLNINTPLKLSYSESSCTPCPPVKNSCSDSAGKGSGSGNSKHQIKYKMYVPQCYKDHDHKNMTLKRPMSPHLQIYGPTVPAMTSITQRISGVIITFYALVLSGSALFLPNGVDGLISMIQSLHLSSGLASILKVLIGFPFGYHYLCGIRYCMFNAGRMLDMKQVYSTGYGAIIGGFIIALYYGFMH